jgi:vesicle coat complex subunit
MNYAKTQPEFVILAVSIFVKDADDPNPLVHALAISTMGCLREEKIMDFLCDPLQKCLHNENAYVRETSACCQAVRSQTRAGHEQRVPRSTARDGIR